MELLYRLGAAWRNPSMFRRYEFLKASERWPLARLIEYQVKECREFLAAAERFSRYYQELFRSVGFRPSEMKSLDDLKLIPPTDKAALVRHNAAIHSAAAFRKRFACETSGTSGEVLTFLRNEEWDSANRAAVMRGYSWYGVQPWERSVYLWGFNIRPRERARVRILDALQNRFRVFSYDEREVVRLARHTRKAAVLHGYSSMIYNIARAFNEDAALPRPQRLKLIKGTSEKIFPAYQEEVKRAFGKPMVSEYGAAEAGLIAFECPHGSMHIHMEGCVVEEEAQEILVTNLVSHSFPIIRYRLGDYIRLAPRAFRCACGMEHRVLEDVMGRVGKVVYGKTRRFPSLSFYYVFKNLYFERGIALSYQVVQEERGKALIDIEQAWPEHRGAVQAELEKYFGNDLDVFISFGKASLPRSAKKRDFVSLVDERQ